MKRGRERYESCGCATASAEGSRPSSIFLAKNILPLGRAPGCARRGGACGVWGASAQGEDAGGSGLGGVLV
ncbi:MAG: hypothetical protein FalmKO_04790 [Falsiruegeria mediterranea]